MGEVSSFYLGLKRREALFKLSRKKTLTQEVSHEENKCFLPSKEPPKKRDVHWIKEKPSFLTL